MERMDYETWLKSVSKKLTGDSLWNMTVYRLALFLSDVAWHAVSKLNDDERTKGVSNQLYRAIGSIGANIAEGYSYSTGGNRARYWEYALGSARESREWYYRARHILGEPVLNHRLSYLTRIVQLLITAVPAQRNLALREGRAEYSVITNPTEDDQDTQDSVTTEDLADLLSTVPLPDL